MFITLLNLFFICITGCLVFPEQICVLHCKFITIFVIPMFETVLSALVNRENLECTVCVYVWICVCARVCRILITSLIIIIIILVIRTTLNAVGLRGKQTLKSKIRTSNVHSFKTGDFVLSEIEEAKSNASRYSRSWNLILGLPSAIPEANT